MGVRPLDIRHGEQLLGEVAEVAAALELGDHHGVGLSRYVVDGADVGDLRDLGVGLQELPLGDYYLSDHGELVAQPLMV